MNRHGTVIGGALALGGLLVAGGCPLLFNDDAPEATPGVVTVTATAPLGDRTVLEGADVVIGWSAFDEDGVGLQIEALVRGPGEIQETSVGGPTSVGQGRSSGEFTWDTTGFAAGVYRTRVRALVAGIERGSDVTDGTISIDGAPTFAFVAPTTPVTVEPEGMVTIEYRADDPEGVGSVQIGIDPDQDHESGNEQTLETRDLLAEDPNDPNATEMIEWDGADADGERVDAGEYFVFAIVDDEAHPILVEEAAGVVTVEEMPDPNEDEVELGFIAPTADTSFETAARPITFEFGVNEEADVLVDLRLDSDDNRANGNEIAILLQRLVQAGVETDTFTWNGSDAAGDSVADGIYTPVLRVTRETGAPQSLDADGLVLVRTSDAPSASRETWRRSTGSWSRDALSDQLAARRDPAVVYDPEAAGVLLFGGRNLSGDALGDTWLRLDGEWVVQDVVGPPARDGHALADNASAEQAVLFGGMAAVRLDDTWTWADGAWTQQTPADAPAARDGHAIAYDAARDVIVLFGGETEDGLSAQTWTYDGVTWTQLAPANSPSARRGHTLFFDRARSVVVLFGGETADGANNETWTWDGTTWTQVTQTDGPTVRFDHAAAFDTARNQGVLFGGTDGVERLSDTWRWNGTRWDEQTLDSAPSPRDGAAMTFDPSRSTLVLVGGSPGIPLISLLTPAANQTVTPGVDVTISWRDDDPSGVATIRLVLDDDETPSEAVETDGDEIEILSGRAAGDDGVLDRFIWSAPRLDPGTYFLFAYIDQDGSGDIDSFSIAPGLIIVPDPSGS